MDHNSDDEHDEHDEHDDDDDEYNRKLQAQGVARQ